MGKKVLQDVKLAINGSSSFLASTAGVLEAAGLWKDDFYKLAGMTGMAFHFIVHEKLCPSSVTVYDWQQEHFKMLDRIGVLSEGINYYYSEDLNTFEFLQKQAIKRIRESIDRGIGVVIWTPTPILEFGIIHGYDDEKEIFLTRDCSCQEAEGQLPYQRVGLSEVPILAYRIIYDRIDFSKEKAYWGSLQFALAEWEKEFHIQPQYATGRKGYQNFKQALQQGEFDPFGLAYVIFSYNQAKKCIPDYLEFLTTEDEVFADLKETATLYRQVAKRFNQMAELVPFRGPASEVNPEVLPQVATLVGEAAELEAEAMAQIKKLVQEQG